MPLETKYECTVKKRAGDLLDTAREEGRDTATATWDKRGAEVRTFVNQINLEKKIAEVNSLLPVERENKYINIYM